MAPFMWHYSSDGEKYGPVARDTILNLHANKVISNDTLVWEAGMAEWIPLHQSELASYLNLDLPAGDEWKVCAYSGDKVRLSQAVELDGYHVGLKWKDDAVQYLQQGGSLPKADLPSKLGSASLDLTKMMTDAWELLKSVLGPALGIYFLLGWILPVASSWALETFVPKLQQPPNLARIYGISFCVGLLHAFWVAGLLTLLDLGDRGKPARLADGLRGSFTHFQYYMLTMILTVPLVILGVFALCVGALVAGVLGQIAVVAAVQRRILGPGALRYAWSIMKPVVWACVGYTFLVALMAGILPGIIAAACEIVPDLRPWFVKGPLLGLVSVAYLYTQTFTFVLYKSLESRAKL
jgi:hypothetical protein